MMTIMLGVYLAAFLIVVNSASASRWTIPCQQHNEPWCNTSLSFAERATLAVSAMTLDEKIAQITTNTPKHPGSAISRLNWPEFQYHSEGLHGVRATGPKTLGLNVTVFPQVTGMAATGNMSLISAMTQVMGVEGRACYNEAMARGIIFPQFVGLFYWSPTLNLGRDPRWGRFQESISEDPFLNGLYSSTFVKGMQGDDPHYLQLAATCKHFIGYSVEGYKNETRHTFNAHISEQDLQESYLPGFRMCVQEASPAQVMCSYNEVNGVPTCASKDLLTGVLREQWGFEGFVLSDEGAIHDIFNGHAYAENGTYAVADALNAGCDQNDGVVYSAYMGGAVAAGLVDEATINTSLQRILFQRFRVGAFDPPASVPWSSLDTRSLNTPEHVALALEAAEQSIVLLNNSAGVLPLSLDKLKTIAVLGPAADNSEILSGGKTDYSPMEWITHLQGVQQFVTESKADVKVSFATGCQDIACKSQEGFTQAVNTAKTADVVLIFLGIDHTIEHEGADRTTIGLPDGQNKLLQAVVDAVTSPVVLVLVHGGPLSSDLAKNSIPTVVDAIDGGQSAGTGLAHVLFGKVNPAGMLPYTIFPEDYINKNDFLNMSLRADQGHTYRFYKDTPLWPFGYSESYTHFKVEWISVTSHVSIGDSAVISANVTNIGSRAGAYIVQAYMQEQTPRSVMHAFEETDEHPDAPNKSLFGLHKVFLQPHESVTVDFSQPTLPNGARCAFCSVSVSGKRVVAPGAYRVQVGGHSMTKEVDEAAHAVFNTITLDGDMRFAP